MNALSLKQMGLASLLAVAGSFPVAPDADAAGYLKIGDIKGESTYAKFEGLIDVDSWSFAGSGGNSNSGPCMSEMNFSKQWDSASDDLLRAFASSTSYGEATLFITGPDPDSGQEILIADMTFKDVTVASYVVSGTDFRPSESLTLKFSEIEGTNSDGGMFAIMQGRCGNR